VILHVSVLPRVHALRTALLAILRLAVVLVVERRLRL
jgi:hypothetical protein